MNLEAEVAKCDKKLDLARLNLEKLYRVISQPDYQATVPEAVQLGNEEKVGICCCLYVLDFKLIMGVCVAEDIGGGTCGAPRVERDVCQVTVESKDINTCY